jgi:hypothetical protein
MRNRVARSLAIFTLALFSIASARAEVSEVRISRGFGVLYLPLMVMESEKLLEIAAKELGRDVLIRLDDGRFSPRATAAAAFIEALTRDPNSVTPTNVEQATAAGVEDDALAEAIYVAFMFNTINRVVDALGFEHRSDRDRRRGAEVLRRLGYHLPGFLLR